MTHLNEDWQKFCKSVAALADECDRRFIDADFRTCVFLIEKINVFIKASEQTKYSIESKKTYNFLVDSSIDDLLSTLRELKSCWQVKKNNAKINPSEDFHYYHSNCPKTGRKGRPKFEIDMEVVQLLKEYSFTWQNIADILGIHRCTLWRRVKNQTSFSALSSIEDDYLDDLIISLKKESAMVGERVLMGMVRSRGIHIQRSRLWDSIHRVDPINPALRWLRQNPRSVYSVPGPNSLWHNDGLHKLVHWKIIIHGCIDGYSRMITYLNCAPNNLASTVLSFFKAAESQFGLPSRIRGDHGTENFELASYVRQKHGFEAAYIQGPSLHNQRIERLHYNTTCVLGLYISLFMFMEENLLLDRNSELDLFCLHSIYLKRIQAALDSFKEGWNNHPLSTEKNRTPYQIWHCGMMERNNENQRGIQNFLRSEDEGIDHSDLYSFVDDDIGDFCSFTSAFSMKPEIVQIIESSNLEEDDGNFGIDTFIDFKSKLIALFD